MSKEIAQTVGGKRIAWLIAIVAAFAVFATVSLQSNVARADVVSLTCDDVDPPVTDVSNVNANTIIYCRAVTLAAITPGTVQWTATGTGGNSIGAVSGATTDTTVGLAPSTSFQFTVLQLPGASATGGFTVTVAYSDANGPHAATEANQTESYTTANATGAVGAAFNLAGTEGSATFALPPGFLCTSDPGDPAAPAPQNPTPRTCALTDVSFTTTGTATATALTVTPSGNRDVAGTVTVTFMDSAGTTGGTVTPQLSVYNALTGTAGANSFVVATATAKTVGFAELRHIPDGVANNTSTVIARQEIATNVRGSRHTICTVAQNTGVDGADADLLADDPVATPVQLPGLTLANIVITNGGGYLSTADTDPDFTDARIFVGDGTALGTTVTSGLLGATCISWVSTDAGDQQINIVYVGADGLNYNVSWDSDNDNNDADGVLNDGPTNTSLIKEWNRLEDSVISVDGTALAVPASTAGALGPIFNFTITRSVVLNPATGDFEIVGGSVGISDIFRGSHTNTAGVNEGKVALAGVAWTVTFGGCDSGSLTGVTSLDASGNVVGGPDIDAFAEGCLAGQAITVTFVGCEPGPLGSGTGICVTEIVTINLVQNIAEKKVFLAWAGQRIILESDWRLPAGDQDGGDGDDDPDNLGECAWSILDQPFVSVTHIKGSGPGNFLPGNGVTVNGADQAFALMSVSDSSQTDGEDIVGQGFGNSPFAGLNGMCISRVLYESEDQGQVDIEAFVDETGLQLLNGFASQVQGLNATKVAFVIYYMKINTINVSLVTQVSKPSHNSSAAAFADYTPGNPWNASLDDADNAAEWNVSRDLLVRGRVTGWFLTTNPSGRAADTSNPLNILPANRWVMPQDWPLLAGGPADPADGTDAIGTAEQFRPYYDIMFAPNNTRGIALTTPEGASASVVAAVVLAATNSTTSFAVSSCLDLPAGAAILVGTVSKTIVSCTANVLTVSVALAATPAAGTPIFLLSGAPFEGPYSTIDIVGFFAEGLGGAALSDWDPNNIRDTTKDDGDVDMWDAPMPAAPVSVSIRGTGFIKQVLKSDVYYLGTANSTSQTYPNPYYIQDIPASPFIPAVVAGGGYHWNTWGNDGPGGNGQGVYRFWVPAVIGTNSEGIGDSFTTAQSTELAAIRAAYGDNTIARDLVVYSDNHGEFMVTANGDYRTDLTACSTNVLALGRHCAPGDHVGTGTITATVDYPDFRGKHFPVLSNAATVTWTWGGYKDVTVEDGETDQFKYIVFHAMDRDGFCSPLTSGAVLLHPVLSGHANDTFNGGPAETIDFLIDSGEGIIVDGAILGTINDGKQFATGVKTFSWALNNPATSGIKEFPLSSLAAAGAVDECQAWIRVSNSLLGILNVLVIAHNDEGNVGFDEIIDLQSTMSYTLNFRWSLITWAGADNISVNDAIKGTGASGANAGGNDISASVTAIYGWEAATQSWLGFFPSGVNVPGANDLVTLRTGQAYWIAITGPSSVTWTIASDVN